MRVKICGVNSPAAFDAAAEAGADWVGFVFFARSPRAVTPGEASRLSARLAGGPARVGLFVDPSDDQVALTLDRLPLDVLQLYACPKRSAEIRARFGVAVWHAVGLAEKADLPPRADHVDGLVVEPKAPAGAGRPGGLAMRLDWPMLAGWQPGVPWLLAGGLDPANVVEAIAASGAQAVDVSSGVETSPGVKDPALIAAFLAAAHAAGHCQRPVRRP